MKKSRKINIFKNMNKPLLIISLIFAICGAFLILDASSISSTLTYGNDSPYYFFERQLICIVISLIGAFIVMRIPSKGYKKLSLLASLFLIESIIFVYVKNSLFSSNVNEVSLNILGFNFQPAEFLKVFIVIYMSSFYDDWVNGNQHNKIVFCAPIILCLLSCAVIFKGGDLGSAVVMAALFAITFISIPSKEKIAVTLKYCTIGGLILGIVILKYLYVIIPEEVLSANYRTNRFIYTNPCDRYEENSGYQVCNGYIAINNGGLFGSGIGESVQKYLYLPASHTDFIFPIIVEELGVIVGIIIIIGYMVILYIIFKISTKCVKLQNSMICFGIGIYIMLQIFINLGGVLGIIPLTGVPLPFLSYGGSSCLTLFGALAVIQRINIENETSKYNIKGENYEK